MWVGTNDGLCRYDGYEFLVFRHDPYDPFSISHNGIQQVVEVGEFLCVHTSAGIDLLDRQTRRFYHLNIGKVGSVASDRQQRLYFFSGGTWVQRLVLTAEVIARLQNTGPEQPSLPSENLVAETALLDMKLSEDGQTLWLLKSGGRELSRLDLASRQLRQFAVPGQDALMQMMPDGANGVWLSGDRIIAHFDATRLSDPWHLIRSAQPINTMWHFDPRQRLLWLDMDATYAFQFDLSRLPATLAPVQAKVRLHIPEGVVRSLTDQTGITWFGTNAHGIRQFNPRAAAFKNYLPGLSIYSAPVIDNQGDVCLGRINQPAVKSTSGHRLRLATGQLMPYPFAASALDMFALYTVADDAGDLWTSGQDIRRSAGKLIHYQPVSGYTEVFHYPIDPQRYFDVLALRYEAPDAVWLYLPYRMLRFDRKTRQFATYDYSQLTEGEQSVMSVAVTADGSQWIALSKSIIRAQPDGAGNFRFSKLENDPAKRNSLPINNIKTLLTDPTDAHILWIGTGGGGLSRLDTRTSHFTLFNTQNGLSNDVVYGIVAEAPAAPGGGGSASPSSPRRASESRASSPPLGGSGGPALYGSARTRASTNSTLPLGSFSISCNRTACLAMSSTPTPTAKCRMAG